jgi:signal peptidase I
MSATRDLESRTEDNTVSETGDAKSGFCFKDFCITWLRTALMTTVLFFLIITFICQGFRVYGSCMEPNIKTGERVLGSKLVYRFSPPTRGDVVVFKYPKDPNKIFIKRVIAMPGETIKIIDGVVYVNGRRLHESYVVYLPHGSYGPEVVRPGNLFVMGDFRDQSSDSRSWGELPLKNIEAKGWLRYWPINRFQLIR